MPSRFDASSSSSFAGRGVPNRVRVLASSTALLRRNGKRRPRRALACGSLHGGARFLTGLHVKSQAGCPAQLSLSDEPPRALMLPLKTLEACHELMCHCMNCVSGRAHPTRIASATVSMRKRIDDRRRQDQCRNGAWPVPGAAGPSSIRRAGRARRPGNSLSVRPRQSPSRCAGAAINGRSRATVVRKSTPVHRTHDARGEAPAGQKRPVPPCLC